MANGSQPGMAASQGGQSNYAQLMHALMTNPQAFTGGGFGQTLAANPSVAGSVMSIPAPASSWQPTPPPQQVAPNPIPGLVAQQQAAQAAAPQQVAAPQAAPPPDLGNYSGGSE